MKAIGLLVMLVTAAGLMGQTPSKIRKQCKRCWWKCGSFVRISKR
jgi:hypothetical protein